MRTRRSLHAAAADRRQIPVTWRDGHWSIQQEGTSWPRRENIIDQSMVQKLVAAGSGYAAGLFLIRPEV
jgi:hypothetical protein